MPKALKKTRKKKKRKPQKSGNTGNGKLTQWQDNKGRFIQGNKANPGGRPTGAVDVMALLRQAVAQPVNGDGRTRAAKILEAFLSRCEEGDPKSIDMFLNRLVGKVPDRIIADTIAGWTLARNKAEEEEQDTIVTVDCEVNELPKREAEETAPKELGDSGKIAASVPPAGKPTVSDELIDC